MTQMCMVSTFLGSMVVAAAIDSGLLPRLPGRERVLLVANYSVTPELATPWYELPAAAGIVARFDRVICLNDDLHPYHPSEWSPQDEDLPLLRRALRSHWGLGESPVDLLVDSLHFPPAPALTSIFKDAPISVLSDGLTSYGPTRRMQPLDVAQRLQRLIYLDMLPGVDPLLLSENQVLLSPVPTDGFKRVVEEMSEAAARHYGKLPDYADRPTALIVGQYLSPLGILTHDEEARLYAEMVDKATAGGAERVVFKPHPVSPPSLSVELRSRVELRGAEFDVLQTPLPVEVFAATARLHSLVSCFSTALVVSSQMYGVPSLSVGTELLLDRLTPYQNSNRVPVTVVDALTRSDARYRDPRQLRELLIAVAYCMQPTMLSPLRDTAVDVLSGMPEGDRARYFKKRRLDSLNLPGATPSDRNRSLLRRIAGKLASVLRGVTKS